jgi:ADP-heptose:LPS heptosyltransferase
MMYIRPWKAVRRDRLFFRLVGLRRMVGFAAEQEMKPRFDAATALFESEPDRLARLIAELGDAGTQNLANWDLRLSAPECQAARDALGPLADGPLIVCGPGTKMPAKDWGAENWQALLGRVARKYPGHSLALVGAKEDFNIAESAARLWTGPKLNLCGRLVPRETAAVIALAKMFLGPDSGPMHLAAAAGVPCVIAFSAAGLPGIWFPRGLKHQIVYHQTSCAGCHLEMCKVHGHPCLTSISIDEMEAAVDRAMNGQDGSRELIVIQ